jgi:serine/threonine protein kinase
MQETSDKLGTDGLEIIEFEQFDTSFAVSPTDEGKTRRRYMTLLAESEGERSQKTRLSDAQLLHVQNTEGASFALKRLYPVPQDADPFARRGREAALFEEYRNQLAVSQLKGFPDVFGAAASDLTPRGKGGDAPGTAVAAIALSILQTLISTEYLEGTFVHRDISPKNIMIQIDDGVPFKDGKEPECCLIDLGSSIFMRRDDASFTTMMDVWRAATPEYVPPEILALNDRSQILARRSPSIDIYALASVLYELYAGTTPLRLAGHPGEDACLIKTQSEPIPLKPHGPEDRGLTDAIMSCIKVSQAERPNARILFREIAVWQKETTDRASIAHDRGIADKDGSVTDGLTKSIALADGTSTAAQVVGYWYDDTEDGGKAGLTFAFTNPIAARAMADASMPEGGWEQCNMRSWLAEDFMDSLPDELSGIIVPAVKLTNNARSTRTASSITSTTDAIWLFSMAELGGTRTAETFASGYGYLADIVNAKDTQYGC